VADLISRETGEAVELIAGHRGEFTIWVNDQRVAQKDSRGFPAEADVVALVKQTLAS
jgi:hypothetical protein